MYCAGPCAMSVQHMFSVSAMSSNSTSKPLSAEDIPGRHTTVPSLINYCFFLPVPDAAKCPMRVGVRTAGQMQKTGDTISSDETLQAGSPGDWLLSPPRLGHQTALLSVRPSCLLPPVAPKAWEWAWPRSARRPARPAWVRPA